MSEKRTITSVILTVYETEELFDTLKSIVSQTQKEIELFLLCPEDKRIEVTSVLSSFPDMRYDIKVRIFEHQNANNIRNSVLNEINGSFVHMIRSGNLLDPELYEGCLKAAEKISADFITFNNEHDVVSDRSRPYKGQDYWNEYYSAGRVWFDTEAYYIRSSFLREYGLYFDNKSASADDLFILRLFLAAEKMTGISKSFIKAAIRESNLHTGFQEQFACLEKSMDSLITVISPEKEDARYFMIKQVFIRLLKRMEDLLKTSQDNKLVEKYMRKAMIRMEEPDYKDQLLCYFIVVEYMLDSLLHCEELRGEWDRCISRYIRKEGEVFQQKGRIALYGTGLIAHGLMCFAEHYTPKLLDRICFLHSERETGGSFYGRPVYNIADLAAADPDLVVLASADQGIQREMNSQLERYNNRAEVYPCPYQIKLILLYDSLVSKNKQKQISVHKANCQSEYAGKRIYILGHGYILALILSSFPQVAVKIEAVIDDSLHSESFAGIRVVSSDQVDLNDPNNVIVFSEDRGPKDHIKASQITLSDLLCDFLKSTDRVFYTPARLNIEACTFCQLNCTGCYMRSSDYGTMGKGYLTFENYKGLLERNQNVEMVELSNSGEVFLNPDLSAILAYSDRQNVKIQMVNGVNLNTASETILEDLVKYHVDKIVVSIDGATQETYARYRRNGNLNHVLDHIRSINQYKKKLHSKKPDLSWQYILMDHNQHEIGLAKKTAEELSMDIYFKLDWRGGFHPDDPDDIRKQTGIEFTNPNAYEKKNKHVYYSNLICRQMIISPQINWDGRLLGCCGIYLDDWGVNVFDYPISEIFNIPQYRSAVMAILSGSDQGMPAGPCGNCDIFRNNVIHYGYRLEL